MTLPSTAPLLALSLKTDVWNTGASGDTGSGRADTGDTGGGADPGVDRTTSLASPPSVVDSTPLPGGPPTTGT